MILFDPAATALEIDAYYDSMLYTGMPSFEIELVEFNRAQAHAKLIKQALEPAGFRRL